MHGQINIVNGRFQEQAKRKLEYWFNLYIEEIPEIIRGIGIEGAYCVITEAPGENLTPEFVRFLVDIPSPSPLQFILEVRHSKNNDFEAEFRLIFEDKIISFIPEKRIYINNLKQEKIEKKKKTFFKR